MVTLVIRLCCEWITLDRGFAWFGGLRWQRPLRVEGAERGD